MTPLEYIGEGDLTEKQSGGSEPQYLSPISSANISNMHPDYMGPFNQMAQEYYQQTGKPLVINDAWRSYDTQAKAYSDWKAGIKKAPSVAPPGHSRHESGMAMDIDSNQADQLAQMGLLDKHGFNRPVRGEPWHVQLINALGPSSAEAAGQPGKLQYVGPGDLTKGGGKLQFVGEGDLTNQVEQSPTPGFESPLYPGSEKPFQNSEISPQQAQIDQNIAEGLPSSDTLAQFGTKVEPGHLTYPVDWAVNQIGKRTLRPLLEYTFPKKEGLSQEQYQKEMDMAEHGIESLVCPWPVSFLFQSPECWAKDSNCCWTEVCSRCYF